MAYSTSKGNTVKWVREQQRHLRDLARGLKGRDLRRLPLRVLHPLVAKQPHAIATVKALYGYLRKVTYELEVADDPTYARLTVPPRKPSRRSKVIDADRIEHALRNLPSRWRALLELQAATGIHTTELQRFASRGVLLPYVGPQKAAAVMVVPLHKNGDEHRVALSKHLAKVAARVLAGGSFTAEAYHLNIRRVAEFTPGRLRHTLATEMVNQGADMATVATFFGHRTPQTTKKWYARFAVPRNPLLEPRRGRRPRDGGGASR